ncbi:MAG: EAL domain-containing protein [Magnetococcus sp. WYHC-3]
MDTLPRDLLRQRALERLENGTVPVETSTEEDWQRLVQELQVHQVELEMQNQELLESQQRLLRLQDEREMLLQRFSALFHHAPVGYLLLDRSAIVRESNETLARMLGCPREDVERQSLANFIHPEDHNRFYGMFPTFFRHAQGRSVELRLVNQRTGVVFHSELVGRDAMHQDLFEGQKARSNLFFVSVHDISEHKRLESALAEARDRAESSNLALARINETLEQRVAERTAELHAANEHLRQEIIDRTRAEERLRLTAQVFESTGEAIVITDKANRIVEVNPAFTRITGYEAAEVFGKDPGFMKSHRHDQAFYADMWLRIWRLGCWQGEIWDRRKDGQVYPKWLTINTIRDPQGGIEHCIGVFSDISRIKSTEEKLEQLAFFDFLTRLPNRPHFKARLDHALTQAQRRECQVGLLFIDLDHFKHVNDSLGHEVGDQLLVEAARRISGCVRREDTVARLGGDEFTIILGELQDASAVTSHVATQVLDAMRAPFLLGGQHLFVGASVGVAVFPEDGVTSETLIRHADLAMYRAKEAGRGSYCFFTQEMNARAQERIALETELRAAISSDQLVLHYQPQVDALSGTVVGCEALLRWQHPQRGLVSPGVFVPLAEETGLIVAMGRWVIHQACRDMRTLWERSGQSLPVAVNLSIRQLQEDDPVGDLLERLEETGLPAKAMKVEITESFLAKPFERSAALLRRMNESGVRIAVDDFGTGYSSLSYLKNFPIHTLKIDRSFVVDLPGDAENDAIVRAIISLARSLGYDLVAEGVETAQQAQLLAELGCSVCQGYYFARPMPLETLLVWLAGQVDVPGVVPGR